MTFSFLLLRENSSKQSKVPSSLSEKKLDSMFDGNWSRMLPKISQCIHATSDWSWQIPYIIRVNKELRVSISYKWAGIFWAIHLNTFAVANLTHAAAF